MRWLNGKPGMERVMGLPVAYEISAGAIVFKRDRRTGMLEFLLLRYRQGHWEFPRGHVETGETLEIAAQREIEEETGIHFPKIIPGFRGKTSFFYVAKGTEAIRRKRENRALWIFKTVYFFLAETSPDATVRLSEEHPEFAWLSLRSAIARATFENAKKTLRDAGGFLGIKN